MLRVSTIVIRNWALFVILNSELGKEYFGFTIMFVVFIYFILFYCVCVKNFLSEVLYWSSTSGVDSGDKHSLSDACGEVIYWFSL